MIGQSVSPSSTLPPVSPRGFPGVDIATLGSPVPFTHINQKDPSQAVRASEGVLASSDSQNKALGSVGSTCCQVGFDSFLDVSLFGKSGSSVALAPMISIVPSACPRVFSQEKQIHSVALSSMTNPSASEPVSILNVAGPEHSDDPLAYPRNSS
ncbi:hypothetical protein Nepgr_008060 [Nepenthes gracilis]|uniref:Uncharacterized protein n=1 Tax=Nepenthes gracilis TaxID=150966 RepID=A0AAD3S883_NEPGR|nr:hypothetical protein Nepgr_008060 [Nepenthes gracilis]